MESINKLQEINIKNHSCNYFDYIININDPDIDRTSLDGKSFENIFVLWYCI